MQSNKHILSLFLKQIYFPGVLEKLSLETPDCCDRNSFLRNSHVCTFTISCTTFLAGLVTHIFNKNQSARSNFSSLKTLTIMVTVILTKNEQKHLNKESS